MDRTALIGRATAAREHSYSSYSHFRVGAAPLRKDGTVYVGCNIENRACSWINCTEQTNWNGAVRAGCRIHKSLLKKYLLFLRCRIEN